MKKEEVKIESGDSIDATMNINDMCVCGHTRYWHQIYGSSCNMMEGYGRCKCKGFKVV